MANNPDAVKAIQYALRAAGMTVKPDGIFGSMTASAVNNAPLQVKGAISTLVEANGIHMDSRAKSSGVAVPWSSVQGWIQEASASTGVPVSYLELCVKHESNFDGAFVYVRDNELGYRGIGQFGSSTWERVANGVPFSEASTNHKLSILAIASLYRLNADRFRVLRNSGRLKRDVTYTDVVAYMCHNQGADGAVESLNNGSLKYPKQSSAAIALFKQFSYIA